jgi:hypothetical protein
MHRHTIAASLVLATSLSSATALASADADTRTAHTARTDKAGSFTVTASVNRSEPLAGSKVKIKGSVKPAASGARVTLQLRYADQKTWKTVDTTTLTTASRYKFKDKVTSVRARKYRVLKPAGPNRAAGRSPAVTVTVFSWRDLVSIPPATAGGMGRTDHVDINGVRYPESVRSYFSGPNGSTVEYNLYRACKAFRGTAGLDDTSASSGTAVVQLYTDGTLRYAGSFGLTQSAPVAFDVTKAFRLTVTAAIGGGGIAAVGTPQVLCSF